MAYPACGGVLHIQTRVDVDAQISPGVECEVTHLLHTELSPKR